MSESRLVSRFDRDFALALADAAADISAAMPTGMKHGTGTYEKWVIGAIHRAFERHNCVASETRARLTDDQVQEWAERHDVEGIPTDLRAMIDDARSL